MPSFPIIITARKPRSRVQDVAQSLRIVAAIIVATRPAKRRTTPEPTERACAEAAAWLARQLVPPDLPNCFR
jgi:hypothetical protein